MQAPPGQFHPDPVQGADIPFLLDAPAHHADTGRTAKDGDLGRVGFEQDGQGIARAQGIVLFEHETVLAEVDDPGRKGLLSRKQAIDPAARQGGPAL